MTRRIHSIVLLIALLIGSAGMNYVQAASMARAMWDANTKTLTFYYGEQKSGGTTHYSGTEITATGSYFPAWYNSSIYNIITTVVFESSFASVRPTSCHSWFRGMPKLTTITGINYLNTTNVTTMAYMFYQSTALTSLDLSSFNTANVTTMGYMFSGCSGLTLLNLSSFNTAKVTNMTCMFHDCSNLRTICVNESGWSTAAVLNGSIMFYRCTKLVGGNGTVFNSSYTDQTRACIDKPGQAGYLTCATVSGTCGASGSSIIWYIDCDGVLNIKGTGAMADYTTASQQPWASLRDNITSIVVGSGITHIGAFAFHSLSNLSSITIPNSVTSIGNYAFRYCYALTSIALPNTLTSIGTGAFRNCTGLTSITIPSSVTAMGTYVLTGTTNLKDIYLKWTGTNILALPNNFSATDKTVHIPCGTISDYTDKGWSAYTLAEEIASGSCGTNVTWTLSCDSTLTISGTGEMADYSAGGAPWYPYRKAIKYYILNGAEIANIGDAAFYNCPNLIGLLGGMPCTIKIVGKKSFMNCPKMKNFTLCFGDNTAIKDSAFYNCSNLGSFTLRGNIVHIGKRAFYNCTNLTTSQYNSITTELPQTITYIGEEAFYNCPNVNDLRVHWTENIPALNNITNMDGIVLRIPCGTRALYDAADGWKDYTIIEGALAGTYGPDIRWTYNICDSTLVISGTGDMMQGSVSSGPLGGRLNAYKDAIKTIIIEEGVTNISLAAFSKCTKLTSVTIPNSVTSIGWASFYQCKSLKSITIPNSVVNLNYNNVFEQCYALTDLYFSWTENVPEYNSTIFRSSSAPKTIHIPCGTTALYEEQGWANSLCTLEDHVLSGTCGADGDNLTWTLCTTDSTLTISGTGAMKDYMGSLDKVPWYSYREAVKSVIVTSGVTNIGDYAFDRCSSLTSVTLPTGLVTIGNEAFDYCSELSSIIIPDNVTSIGNHAFYRCSKMSSVTFPNGLISIGQFAFGENESLSSITIPRSVTDIGWRAFGYWENEYHPNDITVEWTENIPFIFEVTNSSPQSDITLHVPCEAIELYKAADGWKDYTIEGEGGPYTVTVQAEDPTMGDVSIIVN